MEPYNLMEAIKLNHPETLCFSWQTHDKGNIYNQIMRLNNQTAKRLYVDCTVSSLFQKAGQFLSLIFHYKPLNSEVSGTE